MVEYECKRCGYITNRKGNMKNHLNRKNPCKVVLEDISIETLKNLYDLNFYENILKNPQKILKNPQKSLKNPPFFEENCLICHFCEKSFSRSDNLNRHFKSCKKKNKIEQLTLTKMENKIIELEETIQNTSLINNNSLINNTTNNNTTNNNTTNTININLNNYGNENIDYIKKGELTKLLTGAFHAIPKLIEKIHFDPAHPENHNIKITNKKEPYIKVRKNNKWQLQDKKETIEHLIDNKYYILEDHYADLDDNVLKQHTRKMIEKFIERFNSDEELLTMIKHKSEMMILNNS